MEEQSLDTNQKARMVFDYYKQEREEFANLTRERTSLSLQILVVLGALSYAFFQSDSPMLKIGISGVIVILGLLGLMTNVSLGREMRLHVARARAARSELGFLDAFLDPKPESRRTSNGIRQDRLYFAFMILLMVVGFLFATTLIAR